VSSKPWVALLRDGRIVRWSSGRPHIDGDETLTAALLARLSGDGEIALTPVGPVVDLDPADPRAVMAVLREIDPKAMFSRDAPKVAGLPDGAVS
jgi:hypothetical protein